MGEVLYDGVKVEFDDEFSFKVFQTPNVFIPNDTIVYASSFYQENLPDSHVFPDDMTGVKFYNCNLDNVFIPLGNEVFGGTNRRILNQNDLRDWEVDESNVPVTVINEKHWTLLKYSVDPADIPASPISHYNEIKVIPVDIDDVILTKEEEDLVKKLKVYFPTESLDLLKSLVPGEK